MTKVFHDRAWAELMNWAQGDRKTFKRILSLIRDIERDPFAGIGKPERLTGDLAGYWSRRIDDANRIVYRIKDGQMEIAQCGGHYDD